MIELEVEIEANENLPLRIEPEVVGTAGGNDYLKLRNKPSIEDVELVGNKTFDELGMNALSVQEIEKILYLD